MKVSEFRYLTRLLLPATLVLIASLAMPQVVLAFDVTCESSHNQRAYCRTNTSGGVHVKTQMSRSSCQRGDTWGYDPRGIWVSNGCRAVFKVGSDNYNYDHHESHDNDKAAAAIAGLAILAAGAVAVHKSHDDDRRDRDEDDYYRYEPSDHDLHYYRNSGTRHYKVTCESRNNGYQYCEAPVHRSYVRMVNRQSRSNCEFNRDWGYNARGIWVDNGCRAEFEIE